MAEMYLWLHLTKCMLLDHNLVNLVTLQLMICFRDARPLLAHLIDTQDKDVADICHVHDLTFVKSAKFCSFGQFEMKSADACV